MAFRKHTGYLLCWSIFLLSSVETQDVFTPLHSSNSSESALIPSQASTEPVSSVSSQAPPAQQEPDNVSTPGSSQPTDTLGHLTAVTRQPLDQPVDVRPRTEATRNSSSSATGSEDEKTDVRTTQGPEPDTSTSDEGENLSQPRVTSPGPSSGQNLNPSVLTTLPGVPPPPLSPVSITSETEQPTETPSKALGPSSRELATTTLSSSTTHSPMLELTVTTGPFSSTVGPSSTNESISTMGPISTMKFTSTTGPISTNESISASSNHTSTESTTAIGPIFTHNNVSTTAAIITTANSTNSSGVLIPKVPRRNNVFPPSTTTSTKTPDQDKGRGEGGGVLSCPTNRRGGLVSMCLIAIASLAGLATIFMVSTIILCTKLSSWKRMYKMREGQRGTEMTCISALLPEINREVLGRSRIHNRGLLNGGELDSDDGGDDLTLHSFLPDNDRVV
ncbi:P-selectin glycoprotein ligand 1 isoform X2 [Hypomesus transpacificus]|uniref:P-selectin glycoprotein ligand 1 isoform X2 n=1 Tax=Hypomesus transpacificus TaxID=137520 RepID=UPI001F07DDBC|nr:P-selectin glycoprotein ligand 1 isoform X2 [Hypomesus transpacificus]